MGVFDLLTIDNITRVVDTAVAIYNPEIAARRTKVRSAMRLYDGATVGRRGDGFRTIAEGPRDSGRQLAILRQRSRDLSKNNGYAIKAVHGIASNMIGSGIVRNIKTARKNGKKNEYQELWKKWSESTACDFEGLNTFAGLQELAVKTIVESGEVFIRRRVEDSKYYARTKQIPLKLQILDAEFLNEGKDTGGLTEGNTIASGIELNPDGQRVAYHIYKQHPSLGGRTESVRIPASEILHVFRIDRPGQLRGVPWAAPIILNLSDFDAYEDAHLVAKKVAACFAGFIEQPELDDTIDNSEVDSLIDRMEPGMLEYLPAGKKITFGNPPPSTGYAEYTDTMLHKIAAGYQVPYSVLTGDFSKVNFSSGRMGWLEFQRLIDQWRWNMFVPRALDPIWSWFVDLAEILGFSSAQTTADWTAPRREMIDPSKEITATLESVKGGLLSMPEAIREMGYDPDTTIAEIKDWNAKVDAEKIILDSDPRQDPKRLTAENIAKQKITV